MRILLDTNVLVSALVVKHGPSARLLDYWYQNRFVLITSSFQLRELIRVLNYPRILRRIDKTDIPAVVHRLWSRGELFDEALPISNYSADSDDNYILGAAIAGKADVAVTGDKAHLLSLVEVEGVKIITARQALDLFLL